MKILFVGDVIGKPGRRALAALLPQLVDRHRVDYTIVNVENAAGGFGVTAEILHGFDELPIDALTTGNHVWDKKEVGQLLEQHPRLLRPANYPDGNPGKGVHIGESPAGIKVATLNLEGQVFMKPLRSPFETADRLLGELGQGVDVVVVDFHAEATSEKQAMGFYLDGRVSAVIGTHTHVPTADARVLPGGTGLMTDVGMTGPYESIIGFRADKVLRRFALQTKVPFEVAKRDVRLAGVLIEVDESSGRAVALQQIIEPYEG